MSQLFYHHSTMKKTFFHNFLPTKAEEEAAASRNSPCQVTRTLIEVRDTCNPQSQQLDPCYPWQIRKAMAVSEVMNGKLTLSHHEMFDFVFRYWTLEMTNHVMMGSKSFVILFDYTDDKVPKRYQSENIFVEKGPHESYILGCLDLVRSRVLNPGDEIGLFWDLRTGTFSFKLLRRVSSIN